MPPPSFDPDRAAAILLDAELLGATQAAKRWEVSEATISRYRKRLESDPNLQELVRRKKDGVELPAPVVHVPTVQEVVGSVLAFLQRAATEGNHRDPEVIHAVMGGFKIVREVELAERSLSAYLDALASQSAPGPTFQSEGARRLAGEAGSGPGAN